MSELIAFLEKVFDKAYPLMIVVFVFAVIVFVLALGFIIWTFLKMNKGRRRR